ncbi:MAG: PrgI family protein [Patescibacteria group bacterium]
MQFKVPQNVQIEDKILPFMTLRQLIISLIGGGFTYMIYLTLETQPFGIYAPPVIFLALVTAAVAFLKIHGIPFVQFLLLLLERYLNPTKRVWMQSAGDVFPKKVAIKKKIEKHKKKKYSADEIAKLAQNLDTRKKN